jgi:3-oxoadipate enol-lactonase
MGGCVALAMAARHPGKVTGLGLIDTTAWYGPKAPDAWAERAQKALDEGLAAMVGFQTTRWFTDGFRAAHPEAVEPCVATFLANEPAAYAEACRMLGACDLRAALPRIDVPTAVVVGREDYATPPEMAEALHAGIAGSTLTVIEDGRHLTPVEHPARVAAEFLRVVAAA